MKIDLFHIVRTIVLVCVVGMLVGCANSEATPVATPTPPVIQDLDLTVGQTIYVPAYSKVYNSPRGQTVDLTVTLSIHNTDTESPIVLTSVQFYDGQGHFIREYVPEPVELAPLATTQFYVDEATAEASGDYFGSNFIVEWGAEEVVYEPIVETIMIHANSNQGISFTSPGRVIEQR